MCPPALAIASMAVSAIGTGVRALQAASAARFQGKVAEQQARQASEASHEASETGRQDALKLYRKIGDAQGRQQASAAARGVDLGYGSTLDAARDIASLGNAEVQSLYDQTGRAVRGLDIDANNYRTNAVAARRQASNALINGAFDVGNSILGNLTQDAKGKIRLAKAPTSQA